MIHSIVTAIFRFWVYRKYKRQYKLPIDFRFNGYFIRLQGAGNISFGSECYISFYSYINVQSGTSLLVGNNVSIGHNVKIYTSTFDAAHFVKTSNKRESIKKNVKIGDNVVIGANVFICPGVKIGNNVVVGANSVVSKDLPDGSVAFGAPIQFSVK